MGVSQYEIILVNLEPTVGSEIRKTRPCLVLSPNEMNNRLKTVTVAPMTTKNRKYPTRVQVTHNNQVGWVILDQIRTIDKQRIIRKLGHVGPSEIKNCKKIIKETFVD